MIPPTWARDERRRSITVPTLTRRSSRGFRVMSMRPLLSVTLVPSMPMKDDSVATAGSVKMTSPRAC